MPDKKVSLTIIVPVYNSEQYIKKNILKLYEKLKDLNNDFELIVVDDGSSDQTRKILSLLKDNLSKLRLIFLSKNFGKGMAIRKGILRSSGKYIIYYDCDLPYFNKLTKLYKELIKSKNDFVMITREKQLNRSKNDFVMISREKNIYKNFLYFLRRRFSYLYSRFASFLIKGNYDDTQAGLKGFKSKDKRFISRFKTNGFLFDLEIIRIITERKLNIKKIFSKSNIENYNLSYVYSFKFYFKIIIDYIRIIYFISFKKYG